MSKVFDLIQQEEEKIRLVQLQHGDERQKFIGSCLGMLKELTGDDLWDELSQYFEPYELKEPIGRYRSFIVPVNAAELGLARFAFMVEDEPRGSPTPWLIRWPMEMHVEYTSIKDIGKFLHSQAMQHQWDEMVRKALRVKEIMAQLLDGKVDTNYDLYKLEQELFQLAPDQVNDWSKLVDANRSRLEAEKYE